MSVLIGVVALGVWSIIATFELIERDGYGRTPTRMS